MVVYPRVCGGTPGRKASIKEMMGLSPRVRGNRFLPLLLRRRERSIPACAGEPIRNFHWGPPMTVYPRVCGGTQYSPVSASSPSGLSPRVRGNRYQLRLPDQFRRSIPACAGEPSRPAACRLSGRVYPRVCGGTALVLMVDIRYPGLSPRVRGNLPVWRARAMRGGSIPACAGEPGWQCTRRRSPTVYPRVCGGT